MLMVKHCIGLLGIYVVYIHKCASIIHFVMAMNFFYK